MLGLGQGEHSEGAEFQFCKMKMLCGRVVATASLQ